MSTNTNQSVIKQPAFDLEKIRKDFPILQSKINGNDLVYLDNAASTQKPECVIETICKLYRNDYANIHRGVHTLSQRSSEAYDLARERIAKFINANETHEVVFTRGATESINLVVSTFGRENLKKGDNIIITGMEHHANIVPWQLLCEEKGCELRVIPVFQNGELDLEAYEKLIDENTKFVSMVHVSNALGSINPIKEMVAKAKAAGATTLIDAAQSAPHAQLDVQDFGSDFLAFSGHKIFGPTGIGVLWGKKEILDNMPPYQGGGDMIRNVSFEGSTFKESPDRFEAGTPNIAGVIALSSAIEYVDNIGMDNIAAWEHELLLHGTKLLENIEGLRIIGTAKNKAAVISFDIEGLHSHDIGTFLDEEGIAVRTGHHCAEPLIKSLGLQGTSRASMAFYNTKEELDKLAEAIIKIRRFFCR